MTDPDRDLVRRLQRGDRQALGGLYERHRGRLLGYLIRLMPDRLLAEDVFQEVWIKVLSRADSYDPGTASFRSWLYRVASNAAVDRMRREGIRTTEELDRPIGDSGETRIDALPSQEPDPERRGISSDLGRRLDRALGSLTPRQKAAVLLRHQQGMRYSEIASTLEVAEGTAKTLVHRGVLRLRGDLAELHDA